MTRPRSPRRTCRLRLCQTRYSATWVASGAWAQMSRTFRAEYFRNFAAVASHARQPGSDAASATASARRSWASVSFRARSSALSSTVSSGRFRGAVDVLDLVWWPEWWQGWWSWQGLRLPGGGGAGGRPGCQPFFGPSPASKAAADAIGPECNPEARRGRRRGCVQARGRRLDRREGPKAGPVSAGGAGTALGRPPPSLGPALHWTWTLTSVLDFAVGAGGALGDLTAELVRGGRDRAVVVVSVLVRVLTSRVTPPGWPVTAWAEGGH